MATQSPGVSADLITELESILDSGDVDRWLDTPNSLYGGGTPRQWADQQGDEMIRQDILRAKQGIFS
jgi:hypothetical protein